MKKSLLMNFLGVMLLAACGVERPLEDRKTSQNEFQETLAEDLYCTLERWPQAESECLKDENASLRNHLYERLSQWQDRYGFFVAPQLSTLSATRNPLSPLYGRDTGCLKRVLCQK
jgi:hypothetical protein